MFVPLVLPTRPLVGSKAVNWGLFSKRTKNNAFDSGGLDHSSSPGCLASLGSPRHGLRGERHDQRRDNDIISALFTIGLLFRAT
jgi:hypothetical protein